MTLFDWIFGGIENPPIQGQWGPLHIAVMLACVACIIGFHFLVKHAKNQEKTRKVILYTLSGSVLFFEVSMRIVNLLKRFVFHIQDYVSDLSALEILIPRPWCAIACWLLIACVFVNKKFFYNFASLSALLCSVIYFAYPGVGFNSQYLLFDNWYSILTHALLLTTSITLIVLKFTDFKYKDFWKLALCFVATFAYGFIEIFVFKSYGDPMYFMPGGDIQAGILKISYGLYLFLYITLIVVYINAFYLVGDKANVKNFFKKVKGKLHKK